MIFFTEHRQYLPLLLEEHEIMLFYGILKICTWLTTPIHVAEVTVAALITCNSVRATLNGTGITHL